MIDRCLQEQKDLLEYEEGSEKKQQRMILSESSRCALLGIPGAGKSLCLTLMRSFFEEVMGWEHGKQFQYVAAQNSMAQLIGGTAIHHWGAIPMSNKAAIAKRLGAKEKRGIQLTISAEKRAP